MAKIKIHIHIVPREVFWDADDRVGALIIAGVSNESPNYSCKVYDEEVDQNSFETLLIEAAKKDNREQ
jgi:hypothetical protein